MAKALITGGAGFIGSHICDACLEAGDQVWAVDNLLTGARENLDSRARLIEADLCQPGRAASILRDIQPDVVYHLSAQSSVIQSLKDISLDYQMNVAATLELLESARKLPAPPRFVYASTGGASYGDPERIPVSEAHPTAFRSPYAVSKHIAENYVGTYARLFGLPAVSLRLANIYGPRQRGDLEAGAISIFAEKISRQAPITLYGEGKAARDYLFVTDAAAAFRLAAEKIHDGGAYNLGTGVATEIRDVLSRLAATLGRESAEVRLASLREGEIFRISLDAGQFREKTGWRPAVPLAAGIEIFAEWFAEKGGPR